MFVYNIKGYHGIPGQQIVPFILKCMTSTVKKAIEMAMDHFSGEIVIMTAIIITGTSQRTEN